MDKHELRAVSSLAAVFSVRLLGLFMIYPVFATYARELSGATSYKIGLALGIYGLSQGLLQIPFGMLSDRIGRKVLIIAGLAIFGLGSVVAALSTSINGVIAGRLLQGCGAAGSVILALVADLTAEQNRTKAMAMVGVTIGASFVIALVAGPIVASISGVQGIFWLMVLLAAIGIAITQFVVPDPHSLQVHRDAEAVPGQLSSVLMDGELLRLDFGTFVQNAMLTASFLVVPGLMHSVLGVTPHDQWIVYLPVLAVSLLATVPAIIVAEKHRLMKTVFVGAVAILAASQILLRFRGAEPLCAPRVADAFLCGLQRDVRDLAVAHHQVRAARRQRHGYGHLFEFPIPGNLHRWRRGGLGAPTRRRCRRVRADNDPCLCVARSRGYDGASKLSYHADGADFRCPGGPRRKSRREAAPGARCRRSGGDRGGEARLPQGRRKGVRCGAGRSARRRELARRSLQFRFSRFYTSGQKS